MNKYDAPGAPDHVVAFLNECYTLGENAGSWVIDGNTTESTARAILAGIEDGDPEILDHLPSPQWGGEWAGDPTYEQLAVEYGGLTSAEADDYYGEALIAFASGVEDAVTFHARAIL